MWRHVHLRNKKAKIRRSCCGVKYCGLEPFCCVPRFVHAFKGHLNRDGPNRRGGGVGDIRDAKATGGAEEAAGGGKAVGGVCDGHRDLSKLHPAPKKGSHSQLEVCQAWSVVLAHRHGKHGHVASRATRAQWRGRRRLGR